MDIEIQPSRIDGVIHARPSKSCMQRACAAALLHDGATMLHYPGNSADETAAIEIIRQLGATVVQDQPHQMNIIGNPSLQRDKILSHTVSCGESGLALRMFTPIAALFSTPITLTGEGSLVHRPIDGMLQVLPSLGVSIHSDENKLPIVVKGPLIPNNLTIDGSMSSQYVTGLLIALGKSVRRTTTLTVKQLQSKPYIDLTIDVLSSFGYQIQAVQDQAFIIDPIKPITETIHYTVEGDWSNAAFLLVAGAIGGRVTIQGLSLQSCQGDKAILDVLKQSSATIHLDQDQITVSKPVHLLKPFEFDATDCPDLFPPLFALAAYCQGTSVIKGVGRLVHKESNRSVSLQAMSQALGIRMEVEENLMKIYGGEGVQGGTIDSYQDHRIAMAAAILALQAKNPVLILHAEAVRKSYPDFFEDIRSIISTQ